MLYTVPQTVLGIISFSTITASIQTVILFVRIDGIASGMKENAPVMIPRLGVNMRLNKEFTDTQWRGRGPGESYVDSKQANHLGVYSKTVDELFTNYVKPQENGNRSDCDWVSLQIIRSNGLIFIANDKFNFSASYYEVSDLEHAKHTVDLKRVTMLF